MDYGKAFTYVVEDNAWLKKLAIAAVLAFTGIGMIAVLGWALEIIRRVDRGEVAVLPDWTDFGTIVADGLKAFLIVLVWSLPIWVLGACPATLTWVAGGENASDGLGLLLSLLMGCGGLVSTLYGVLLGILAPAALGHLAIRGQVSEAINPAYALRLVRAAPGAYVLVWLISAVAGGVLAMAGTVLCGVGIFAAAAYHSAVMGHLTGQAYREGKVGMTPASTA